MTDHEPAGTEPEVQEYLGLFQGEVLERLNRMRAIVREEAPRAIETTGYGLIAYKLQGRPLVYIGGFAKHIGFYATPTGHAEFAADFETYKQGKGSVQLPLDQPLPCDLIRRVVRFRVTEVLNSLPAIGRPATSALAEVGIHTMSDLQGRSAAELSALHGVGPKAIRLLRQAGAKI